MTNVNPRKILNSQFTRVSLSYKENNFIVDCVNYAEFGAVGMCIIEAVINSNEYAIDWR